MRRRMLWVGILSAVCLAAGLVGIGRYVSYAVHQSDRGWCDFISAAQPRNPQEHPMPGGYGDRLLQALDRRGNNIGCEGIPTPRR